MRVSEQFSFRTCELVTQRIDTSFMENRIITYIYFVSKICTPGEH
jgi:hypothetical protein